MRHRLSTSLPVFVTVTYPISPLQITNARDADLRPFILEIRNKSQNQRSAHSAFALFPDFAEQRAGDVQVQHTIAHGYAEVPRELPLGAGRSGDIHI